MWLAHAMTLLRLPLAALWAIAVVAARRCDRCASRAGKLTTAAQFAAIIAFLLEPPPSAILAIATATAALGFVTALGYIRAARRWRTQPQ